MAEVLSSLEQGLGELVRKVGRMFMHAYGLEKSAISERLVEASRKKLEELMSRSADLCAVH